jgi:type II secretory pathway pseudopilin PulG
MNAGSMSAPSGPGARKFGGAKMWLTGLAALLLILAGASAYGLVKLSSVQASLSRTQQQVSAERSELSAEQQQLNTDGQELSTLQSTVNTPAYDPLSAFTSMVCSNSDVYDSSTGQTITAYYPCTDKNPN